jgi:hypothetical protein
MDEFLYLCPNTKRAHGIPSMVRRHVSNPHPRNLVRPLPRRWHNLRRSSRSLRRRCSQRARISPRLHFHYGALRASYGRTEPYSVSHLEIGNEDNYSNGCSTYASRFTAFYEAIHAAYPDITIITSTSDSSCLPNPLPEGVWTDIHHYEEPAEFIKLFNEFDNVERTNGLGIFVGEYANTATDSGAATYVCLPSIYIYFKW